MAIDGVLIGDVQESHITSLPDAPLEVTVKFLLGLGGSDPIENSIRIDI